MLVNRRTALKQVLVVSAGLALLPACLRKPSPASISLKNIAVDAEGESMLAALAETLIPATANPGAKEVKAHLFALTMVDDCFKKEDQEKFVAGIKSFSDLCRQKNGHSFEKSSPAEREALLKELEAADAGKDTAAAFYRTAKELTIYGYTTSEYYLTKVQVYELVPGRFHGSVDVKPASKRTA